MKSFSKNAVVILNSITALLLSAAMPDPAAAQAETIKTPEVRTVDITWSYVPENQVYVHVWYGYAGSEKAFIKLYRRDGDGQWKVRYEDKFESGGASASDYTANQVGTTYYYYATATKNGVESAPSAVKSITLKWPECLDSDSDNAGHRTGVNYGVRGTLNGKTDYCETAYRLVEYFCGPKNDTFNTGYRCQYGCRKGACLTAETAYLGGEQETTSEVAQGGPAVFDDTERRINELMDSVADKVRTVAIRNKNIDVCNILDIGNGVYAGSGAYNTKRELCKNAVAEAVDDPVQCNGLQTLGDRQLCYGQLMYYHQGDVNGNFCEKITDSDYRWRCFNQAAANTMDPVLCEKAAYQVANNGCYPMIAKRTESLEECLSIMVNSRGKEDCYSEFERRSGSSSGLEGANRRDALRQSDMRQLVSAQEMYYGSFSRYLGSAAIPSAIPGFMNAVPRDPGSGTAVACGQASPAFTYCALDNTADTQKFCYFARLEADKDHPYYTASELGNFKRATAPATLAECGRSQ